MGRLTPQQQALVVKFAPLARFLAERYTRSHLFEYDDLVSVAYLSLMHAVPTLGDPGRATTAYLARVIRCDLVDHIRREGRLNSPRVAFLLDSLHAPDGSLGRCDSRDEVEYVLARLPREASEAFRLHYLEGLSLAETGRRLGRVPSRVFRIMKAAVDQKFPPR